MKHSILFFLLLIALLFPTTFLFAQKQLIKVNATSMLIKNASISYERAIHPKMSLSLGVGVLPDRTTSLIALFVPKTADLDDEVYQAGSIRLKGFNVTPEFRWYPLNNTSYEAPFGFYLAAFLRYFNYTLNGDLSLKEITDTDSEMGVSLNVWGVGGGIMIGNQVKLGKRVTLDVGLGYGRAPGGSNGTFKASFLSEEDFQAVIDYINGSLEDSFLGNLFKDFEFEPIEGDLTTEGSGKLNTKAWHLMRANLALGIAF